MLIELLLGIEEINRLLRLQSIRYGFCKLIAISDIESVTSKLVVQVSCLLSLLVIELTVLRPNTDAVTDPCRLVPT